MNKEEKERKEAAAKAEFELRMRQLQATGAPSADDLLKSVGSIPLSPGDSPESNPAAVVAAPQDDFPERPQPPPSPQSLPSSQPPLSPQTLTRAQLTASRVNATEDPKLEALLDTIAEQIKAQRRQHSPLNPRVLVKADSDTFSRVSRVSFARRLDKTEVLTYLLSRYLPDEGRQEPPAWLVQERPDDVLNAFPLVYAEDSEIATRFAWLEQRFGLLKVDIVAAIVTRYLPASPFVVPPKRRARRKRY
jgi:hypothetical protein